MELINKYLEKIAEKEAKVTKDRFKLQMSGQDFAEVFKLAAKFRMLERGTNREFIIDDQNKEVINQLYFYLTGSEKFSGDLSKGILLVGSIGVGKTIIIQAIIDILKELQIKIIAEYSSRQLVNDLMENKGLYEDLKKRWIYIDDIGKEKVTVNNYGTKESPIIELLSIRYEWNTFTFATSNYNMETFEKIYGQSISDRFKEMFNILTITGKSRR